MTHPTLPSGFSTDFSKAPRDVAFLAYFAQEHWDGEVEPTPVWAWFDEDDALQSEAGPLKEESCNRPLCWCPIPTPGDVVLKELAEGK